MERRIHILDRSYIPSKKIAAKLTCATLVAGAAVLGIEGAIQSSQPAVEALRNQAGQTIQGQFPELSIGGWTLSEQTNTRTKALGINIAYLPLVHKVKETPPHDLVIKKYPDGAYLSERKTGKRVDLAGWNYVRLDYLDCWHSTLVTGEFNSTQIDASFKKMAEAGLTGVRLFSNECLAGNPNGEGLDPKYIDNITQVTKTAERYGLFVMLNVGAIPDRGGYKQEDKYHPLIKGSFNRSILDQEGLREHLKYMRDLITGLKEKGAALNRVIIEDWNEKYLLENEEPFNLNSGLVTTADNITYDLSKGPEEKKRMAISNLINELRQTKKAIKEIYPSALFADGFFAPMEVEDPRRPEWISTREVILSGVLDIVDLHFYPWGDSLEERFKKLVASFQGTDNPQPFNKFSPNTVFVMGEFGMPKPALVASSYDTTEKAGKALQDWVRIARCLYGIYNHLGWTYDTYEHEPGRESFTYYYALENKGEIYEALKPGKIPPCTSAEKVSKNTDKSP